MKKWSMIAVCALAIACMAPLHADDSPKNSHSALLQDDYKQAFTHLDEIAGTLQYIAQVVNTSGAYNAEQKRAIRIWTLHHIGVVKNLRPLQEKLNEQTLMTMLRNTRVLLVHINSEVDKNFLTLAHFVAPITEPITEEAIINESVYKTMGSLLVKNRALLRSLQESLQTLGLTSTNILARQLDDLNSTYRITDILEALPRLAGIGLLGLWLFKYKTVQELPFIGKYLEPIKRKVIGTSEYFDPQGFRDIKYYGQTLPDDLDEIKKTNKTWAEFFTTKDRHTLERYAGWALILANYDTLSSYIFPFKSSIRKYWNKLKGFNHKKIGTYRHPEITLDDERLVGLDSQVEQMKKIVQYITEPEKYDRTASGLEKGILLTGPSRSGKTLLANALCGSINDKMQEKGMDSKFAFKQITWSDVVWKSDDGIKSIIEDAKQNAPCVIFLDELHNLPLQTKEGGKTLSQFLTMSESLQSTGVGDSVIILAATNRAHALDDALLKPGRFGLQIHFENPTFELRKKFFTVSFTKNALDENEFDSDNLARQTESCSYGDLDMVFKNARFTAHNKGRDLRQEDFQESIDVEINRIRLDQELPLTDEARTLVATHQAGHAFMYMLHENELNERLETVTIRGTWRKIIEKSWLNFNKEVHQFHHEKKIKYGKIFTSKKSEAVDIAVDPLLKAKVHLAGTVAEQVLLGATTYSYHPKDKRKALAELERLTMHGLSAEDFIKAELIEPKQKAKQLLERCEKELIQLMEKNKKALKQLTKKLQTKTILRHDEIKKILEKNRK